jgi:hypothetical protein
MLAGLGTVGLRGLALLVLDEGLGGIGGVHNLTVYFWEVFQKLVSSGS